MTSPLWKVFILNYKRILPLIFFKVYVIKNENWENPLEVVKSKSQTLQRLMRCVMGQGF